jgi:hypothetical protein
MDRREHGPKMGRNVIEEEEGEEEKEKEEEEEEEICREEMRKTKTTPAGMVGIPTEI